MKNKKKKKPGPFTRRAAAGAFAVLMAVSLAACASGGSKARTGQVTTSSDTESIAPDNYTAIVTDSAPTDGAPWGSGTDAKASDYVTLPDDWDKLTFVHDSDAVKSGDRLDISYTYQSPDDADMSGSKVYKEITCGSDGIADGFDAHLVGLHAGESTTFVLPDNTSDVSSDASADRMSYTVTVNHVMSEDGNDVILKVAKRTKVSSYPSDLYQSMSGAVESYESAAESASSGTSGVSPLDVGTYAKASVKMTLVSYAILEAAGIPVEGTQFSDVETKLLAAAGYPSLADAVSAGVSETSVRDSTAYTLAVLTLEDKAASSQQSE